ncbi:DUF6057 family protein [Draconibacterium sp. IB214405]|uniref:DUF6057 family protein n=1 Tax=Draconibacterium sp. IB214405 TaxID=3097352 RepID=UPI002A158DE9|nr:DUF6057 family protein [Draconibacterium sp. IB214405]MDX8338050.1 DUF6057 family protein [Draconibacterium sp. IB214405]
MKQNIFSKIISIDTLLSLVFGGAVFVFFGFYYSFHLNYQEQYQLFLFTPQYLLDFIKHPGGASDYLGNFFTQFFFYSKIGALTLAAMLVILQRIILATTLKLGVSQHWMPLTLIPSILYWSLLCDENYMLGGLVAMILLALFCLLYLQIKRGTAQRIVGVILLLTLYWAAGGVFIFFTLFMLFSKFAGKSKIGKNDLSFAIILMLITPTLPYLAKLIVLQYPMQKFWIGVNYFRFPVSIPTAITTVAFLIPAIPFFLFFISKMINVKKAGLVLVTLSILISAVTFGFIRNSADFSKEEVMAYDFHIRMRRWDRAIALADEKAPTSPLSVTCLNLALAETGQLGEKMFEYYQNGISGLLPDFTRDFTIPIITGEVYYHLGLINTAQRFAFEAMEALPDYQKSVRSVKRLAETNIINGDYEVAKKYLHLLQKTLYYKNWATRSLEIIKNEKQVEQHIEWGWLRSARIQEDFLFSEQEKLNMIGLLFMNNRQNKIAFEYLAAATLLEKDLQQFIRYFPLSSSLNYKVIPKHFQEALLYIWEVTNDDPTKEISYPINNAIRARLNDYKKQYGSTRDAKIMEKGFGDTYWYYLHFRN